MKHINQFDLAFVVDTTASMSNLIHAAQKQLVQVIDALADGNDVDMRLGIVEYRDHPPQDNMVSRVYPFTDDSAKAKKTIKALKVDGGGDAPEAVFAGVFRRCENWNGARTRVALPFWSATRHRMALARPEMVFQTVVPLVKRFKVSQPKQKRQM